MKECKDEKSLYIYALNRDFDVETAKEILEHPCCSLAIALCLFYKSQEFDPAPGSKEEMELIQFSQNLYLDIKKWKYVPREMGYKVPLSPSQKFKLNLELEEEDKILIRDVPGILPESLS